ncbi:MAG: hypothetical protein MI923_00905 [Phycisphaerales bacterium]|nr:hypothetical protein [Phycisphaerales bacterium]
MSGEKGCRERHRRFFLHGSAPDFFQSARCSDPQSPAHRISLFDSQNGRCGYHFILSPQVVKWNTGMCIHEEVIRLSEKKSARHDTQEHPIIGDGPIPDRCQFRSARETRPRRDYRYV